MKVCIAEKPSVAREIAQVVGASSRKDGYFEGNGYAVTWTFGHFCTLYAPDDYSPSWKRWHLDSLPMLPEKFLTKLMNDSGVKKQFKVIKKLFKQASVVINCGDAGQEGELIQRWVIKEAKYTGQVKRLWISSLTKEAVKEGFERLKAGSDFDSLFFAGSARAIGDWLLGMNATRLYTLKYGGGKQVLSIGRVQTPTLAMLVARHKEIINFVSSPFWELHTIYKSVQFKYEKGRFQAIEEGQGLLQRISDKPFTIISFTKKKGKEYAPKLFDLTGLQVHCNKRFGYSADMTLKLVQKLYEQKLVSYPRVDTSFLPNDVYPKIKGILGKLTNYQQFTQPLLSKPIKKSKRVFNDKKVTDHHAIIPTGVQATVPNDQQKVYDAICRRFIANFYPECDVNNTTVIGESDGLRFKATGKEIVNPGWKVLFPKSTANNNDNNKKEEETILPPFTKGESGPHKPTLIEKKTQPPKYYTEATLLRAMETAGKTVDNEELRDLMKENGIGRPSTRANIIETLFKRKYCYRKRKLIMPTDLGIQLIDTIENPLLTSAELTGQWERKLRMIEQNEYNPAVFIQEMKDMTDALVTEVRLSKATSKIDVSHLPDRFSKSKFKTKPKPKSASSSSKKSKPSNKTKTTSKKKAITERLCPQCQKGTLIKGKTAFGCTQWKSGCRFTLPFLFMGKKISENQYKRLLDKGATVSLKGFKQDGKKVNGLLRLNDKFQLVLEQAKTKTPTNSKDTMACPKCRSGKIIKGKTAYGCSRWKEDCDFTYLFSEIKRQAKGQALSKELVKAILAG